MSSASTTLTPEQATFVREFLVDLNGTEAAVRMGIDRGGAKAAASKLLNEAGVLPAIGDQLARKATRTVSTPQLVREILARKVPARRGAVRLVQAVAARRGIAISRLRKPAAGDGAAREPLLHVHHKGHCFYCRGDGPITSHLLQGKEWDPHFKRILRRVGGSLKSGTIVEVGANIGASFIPECRDYPHLQFVMIEPLPPFFELLEKNARSFGASNAQLRNVAASNGTASELVLIYDSASGGVAAASSFLGHQSVALVPSRSLDEMFPTERIALLKADVDGYECDVFNGGRELIKRSRPHVLFEFNPLATEVRGIAPLELPRMLAAMGVGHFDVYRDDGSLIETTREVDRIWDIFTSLQDPLGHIDVHAYPADQSDA